MIRVNRDSGESSRSGGGLLAPSGVNSGSSMPGSTRVSLKCRLK